MKGYPLSCGLALDSEGSRVDKLRGLLGQSFRLGGGGTFLLID